jgi:hypothetical protein
MNRNHSSHTPGCCSFTPSVSRSSSESASQSTSGFSGFATRIPLASMRDLFRYLWLGFWINAVSGAMLFAADAPRKAQNPLFEIKLALVALGVTVMALVDRHLLRAEASRAKPRERVPNSWQSHHS